MKILQVKLIRLNNSYESEPSSGSGSLGEHHDNTISDEENMNLPYLLKPPSYQNEITIGTTNLDSPNRNEQNAERDLRYGLSENSSPESPFAGFGDSPYGKLKRKLCEEKSPTKKTTPCRETDQDQEAALPSVLGSAGNGPSPGKLLFSNFYDVIAEENSCNAVDVVLSNEVADSQIACSGSSSSTIPSSELSFNGKIKTMCNSDKIISENSIPEYQPLTIAAQRLPNLLESTLNRSFVNETSFVLKKYTNEKSPDLFEEDDDDDEDDDQSEENMKNDQKEENMKNDQNSQNDQKNDQCNDGQIKDNYIVDLSHTSYVHIEKDLNIRQLTIDNGDEIHETGHENYDQMDGYNNYDNYNPVNVDHNDYIDSDETKYQKGDKIDEVQKNYEKEQKEVNQEQIEVDHNKNVGYASSSPITKHIENIYIEENPLEPNGTGLNKDYLNDNNCNHHDDKENCDRTEDKQNYGISSGTEEMTNDDKFNAHIDEHHNIDQKLDLNSEVSQNVDSNIDHKDDEISNESYDKTSERNYDKIHDEDDASICNEKLYAAGQKFDEAEETRFTDDIQMNSQTQLYPHGDDYNKNKADNANACNSNEIVDIQESKIVEIEESHLTNAIQTPSQTDSRTLEDIIEEISAEQKQDAFSTNKLLNCPTESSFTDDQSTGVNANIEHCDNQSLFRANCRREKELLNRTRLCLSGVPPPPTVTTPQIDVIKTVLLRKNDILNFYNLDWPHQSNSLTIDSNDSTNRSLLKPTHTLEETQSMGWRDILSVRQHGLSFNLSKASESNEYLSLSVIDRFVGEETASSYHLSPSSAKKRNLRIKMLTASPGSRLSHLAKRRAVFSSAHLANTSLKSTSSLGTQILLDKKKSKNRRKATPKRKTPASKKKNIRKTPSSSARKRPYRCDSIKAGPSRETSKRALFQSPAKTLQPLKSGLPKPTIKPEIATRVEKSKRALFSPDNLSQNSSHSTHYNSYIGGDSSNSSHAYVSTSSFSMANSSSQTLDTLLQKRKRHRADNDDEDDAAVLAEAQNCKIFRGSKHSLTPRALQIKSQSFCIGAGSSAHCSESHSRLIGGNVIEADLKSHRDGQQYGLSSSQMLLSSRNNSSQASGSSAKLLRAQSEHASMSSSTNSLTENQRKKLLWAVSQALQEKKITAKHESFKEFASVLARVVRRIFQEYYLKGNASNSETMLRLAKKYAFNVIAGKNVDDIYFHAKAQIDEHKRKSINRLSGYIAPEEYENHKLLQQKLSQKSFNGSMQNIFGTENSMDCLSMSLSQASSVGLSTTLSSIAMTSQASNLDQMSQPELVHNSGYSTNAQQQCIKLPVQPNATLQKSSSKSNICGLALRENVDCEQRRSAQKNFTGKDQRNVSPYAAGGGIGGTINRLGSAVKLQSNVMHDLLAATAAKAKRQISFDS